MSCLLFCICISECLGFEATKVSAAKDPPPLYFLCASKGMRGLVHQISNTLHYKKTHRSEISLIILYLCTKLPSELCLAKLKFSSQLSQKATSLNMLNC